MYFDADGSTPNKAVRTFKSNSTCYLKTTFAASVSGKWSVRWGTQGSVAAASSVQAYVKVVPAPKPTSAKPASKWRCPAWAPIKGDAPSKIYHLKGQRFYVKTTPEICFSTETAAKAAGYRKSKV
ncbi:sunset domain-containing protein [Arthrobacter sp. HLT1-20]